MSTPVDGSHDGGFADYEKHDATGLAQLVRAGEVTAHELLDAALARIEAHEPQLHALVHRFEEKGRQAIDEGLPVGPFTGVPFLLKNTGFEMAGTILSTGSRLFKDAVSARDGTLVARYKAAGLVILAKTNTPEFALSFTTEPEAFGPSRNPWDTRLSPGGSSGGSTAAVAAGYVPMANTSDGAGSTRLPASHCGLFGFKPSRMVNPLGPIAVEAIAGMSTPHAASWSVRDNAALLDASGGADIGDPYLAPVGPESYLSQVTREPRPLRIGFTPVSPLGTPVDPDCVRVAQEAAKLCEELGHTVEICDAGYDAHALKAAWRIIVGANVAPAVAMRGQALGLADPLSYLESVNAEWVEEARGLPATAYVGAVNVLHQMARSLGRFFQSYDVLLSPTAGELPPPLGTLASAGKSLDAFYDAFWTHAPFTCVFNASGCPAMSVPLGTSATGLPVGAHFGAGFGKDGLLFQLAGQLERARPWFGRRPSLGRRGDHG
ncbi:amidase [Angulomicrobium tetraedrale]|uniref:Amidase n=1 Tax=Ancylobacter tetraedralis TaxID=217068 RepID=A0A839ZD39_9HYPH|nr:amidase [Ancylobacter tetraedralis]MBB3772585.1 amidase [Ancylobacter tetraedralis]